MHRSKSSSDNSFSPAKHNSIHSNETSNDSKHTSQTDRAMSPVTRKTVLARAELWDRRISTADSEVHIPTPNYDIEQWSSEFEKIQNQN